MQALRELNTTVFGPDQEAIAWDSDVATADTLSTAKRVDRSVDDDEYFSNVNAASPQHQPCRTSFMKIHAELFTLRTLQDQVAGGQITPPLTNLLVV